MSANYKKRTHTGKMRALKFQLTLLVGESQSYKKPLKNRRERSDETNAQQIFLEVSYFNFGFPIGLYLFN